MTTRPTDTPAWATAPSGGAVISEPVTGKQIQGWLPFEKPPSGAANWAWNRFASWVAHFAGAGSVFPTLEGAANAPAAAPLAVGDSCLINEPDGGEPGDTILNIATLLTLVFTQNLVDSGGQSLVFISGDIKVVERDGSAEIRSIPLTNPATAVTALITDGDLVIAAYDAGGTSTVEAFNISTGVQAWLVTPVSPSGTVRDLAMDDERVYVASDDAGRELIALNRSTGATVWAYDHSGVATAQLWSVATNGKLVFVAGVASGHASLATLRAVVAVNGFDFNGEGGLGTDAVLAWNAVQGSLTQNARSLSTDGRGLYIISGAGTATLEVRGNDGVIAATKTIGTFAISISVDQDYAVVVTAEGTLGFTKDLLMRAWIGEADGRVITDGSATFTATGKRIARGNSQPARFRRVDPATEKWLPLRQLLIPVDRA